jgi:hypothetical protein
VIGLVLAFVVTAILLSLFGFWIVGIPVAIVALVLFVLFVAGFGRRAGANKP